MTNEPQRGKQMRGILQAALTSKLRLELDYRPVPNQSREVERYNPPMDRRAK